MRLYALRFFFASFECLIRSTLCAHSFHDSQPPPLSLSISAALARQAFVVVFSLTDEGSYKEAVKLVNKVEKLFYDSEIKPLLLLGNKCVRSYQVQ